MTVIKGLVLFFTAPLGVILAAPLQAADRFDDIIAITVRDTFGGQKGLYLSHKRGSNSTEKLGTINLFCSEDGPGWAIIRAKGQLVAINGTGKTWAGKGMEAFLRNGSSESVASAADVPEIDKSTDFGTIAAARAPCEAREPRGINQTLERLREAAARYAASTGDYRLGR